MNILRNFAMLVIGIFVILALQGYSGASNSAVSGTTTSDTTRSIAPYFTHITSSPKAPDAEGFLQRWLLLEPINKPNRSNTVFTDSYIRNAFDTLYFPRQFTVVPHDGDKVKVGRPGTRMACIGCYQFQCQTFSIGLWFEQTDIRRSVLGSYCCQQPKGNEECSHGSWF